MANVRYRTCLKCSTSESPVRQTDVHVVIGIRVPYILAARQCLSQTAPYYTTLSFRNRGPRRREGSAARRNICFLRAYSFRLIILRFHASSASSQTGCTVVWLAHDFDGDRMLELLGSGAVPGRAIHNGSGRCTKRRDTIGTQGHQQRVDDKGQSQCMFRPS